MGTQSISCPRCGSGDVQEAKPNKYFCNHCDNVFMYASPLQSGEGKGCEVLVNGEACGVPAIGRCATDGRAFCMTHQARTDRLVPIINQCKPCRLAAERATREKHEAYENKFGETYLREFAPQELKAAGLPVVQVLHTFKNQVRGPFGRHRTEEHTQSLGTGWLLGSFTWSACGQLTIMVDNWLYSNSRTDFFDPIPSSSTIYSRHCRLLQVRQSAKGYELSISHESVIGKFEYREICIAIHKLVGTSGPRPE